MDMRSVAWNKSKEISFEFYLDLNWKLRKRNGSYWAPLSQSRKEISSEHWILKIGLHTSGRHVQGRSYQHQAVTRIKMSFLAAFSFTTYLLEQTSSIIQKLAGISYSSLGADNPQPRYLLDWAPWLSQTHSRISFTSLMKMLKITEG